MITSPDPAPVRPVARAADRAVSQVPESSAAGRVFGDFVEDAAAAATDEPAAEAEAQPQTIPFAAVTDLVADVVAAGEGAEPPAAPAEGASATGVEGRAVDIVMLDAPIAPAPVREARVAPEPAAGTAAPIAIAARAPVAGPDGGPAAQEPEQPAPDGEADPSAKARGDGPPPPSLAEPRSAAALAPAPAQPQAPTDIALRPAPADGWRLAPAEARSPDAPSASPPATAAAAANAREIAGQITLAIGQTSERDIEIRLDPPELGRVQIRLNPHEGGVQALVLADRPETQDFLRRHGDALVRDLEEAGFGQVSLDFAAGGEAPQRDASGSERRFAAAIGAAPASPDAVFAAPPQRTGAGGLDIRI